MTDYVISYDLRQDALKKVGAVKALESVWFLSNDAAASTVRDWIAGHVDANDRIVIIEIGRDWAGRNMMPGSAEWLKARRP